MSRSSSGRRLIGGSKVVIDDGTHVDVEELIHTPDLSPPPKRATRNNGGDSGGGGGAETNSKTIKTEKDGSRKTTSSASPVKKPRNVALVEFVAEPASDNDDVSSAASDASATGLGTSNADNLSDMKNRLLADLDCSIDELLNARAENLTELFFLQV